MLKKLNEIVFARVTAMRYSTTQRSHSLESGLLILIFGIFDNEYLLSIGRPCVRTTMIVRKLPRFGDQPKVDRGSVTQARMAYWRTIELRDA